ncbi:hypothetical protein HD554DRAFT_28753 [Boletus coccyginus]|nr:hypothetical protein HD554DRAFT_28753 [Boletus coccyginus]
MSLFKWSTPERQKADRILPIIPNEIYLCIFEYIAPPIGRLTPGQLRTYAHLSWVCRFFANFCLPRIFEFVEFSGAVLRNDMPTLRCSDAVYKTSREATLCTQIAADQPLALALAERVTMCHFTNWQLDDTGSWAVRLFANKYIAAMSHMRNIRELGFFQSSVDAEHWDVIATLPLLEKLEFHSCRFLKGPADLEPEKRVMVKPSCLWLVGTSTGFRQPLAAIDFRLSRPWHFSLTIHLNWTWSHGCSTNLCGKTCLSFSCSHCAFSH